MKNDRDIYPRCKRKDRLFSELSEKLFIQNENTI